jgi:hypothetical protein
MIPLDKLIARRNQAAQRINMAQRRFVQHAQGCGNLRKFRRAKSDLARARYDFDSVMLEWAEAHPHIGTGLCPICLHAGEDCTGKKARAA